MEQEQRKAQSTVGLTVLIKDFSSGIWSVGGWSFLLLPTYIGYLSCLLCGRKFPTFKFYQLEVD